MELRYQRLDKYGQPCFICNKSSKYPGERESYEELKRLARKLQKRYPGTFLPIFCNKEKGWATVRLRKTPDLPEFKTDATYGLQHSIRVHRNSKNDKEYISVWYEQAMLLRESKFDKGVILQLSDSEASDSEEIEEKKESPDTDSDIDDPDCNNAP